MADSPAVAEGRRLAERLACRRCHQVGGAGNQLAVALDRVVWVRDQRELSHSIAEPVENMPRFGLDTAQSEAVVAYLLHVGDRQHPSSSYRVRFTRREIAPEHRFDSACGGCHRTLTPVGPFGRGSAGPNLSGLFSTYYPPTAPGERPWEVATLVSWVKNPRALRPGTTMRPVPLTLFDLQALAVELEGER